MYVQTVPRLLRELESAETPEDALKAMTVIAPTLSRPWQTARPARPRRYKPFYNDELNALRRLRNTAKRHIENASHPEVLAQYKHLRRIVSSRTRATKKAMQRRHDGALFGLPNSTESGWPRRRTRRNASPYA